MKNAPFAFEYFPGANLREHSCQHDLIRECRKMIGYEPDQFGLNDDYESSHLLISGTIPAD